jgi:hypothetical protein
MGRNLRVDPVGASCGIGSIGSIASIGAADPVAERFATTAETYCGSMRSVSPPNVANRLI